MQRIYNFSPGPAVLPLSVLEEVQRDMLALPGLGVSVLEIGHRTKWFEGVLETTIANLRRLLQLPDNYQVVFTQGGSRLLFSSIPMNLPRAGKSGRLHRDRHVGSNAEKEARREGEVRIAYSAKDTNFDRLPTVGDLKLNAEAAYVHFTSNETIQGVQFLDEPSVGKVPLVCDASSDFLCRPLPMDRYGLLYACAQKNAGPAGVTIAILRDDVLAALHGKRPHDAQLSAAGRKQFAVEHATGLRRVRGDAGHALVAGRYRRPGQDARVEREEIPASVRSHRRKRRLLPGTCTARLPLAHERDVSTPERRSRGRISRRSQRARPAILEGGTARSAVSAPVSTTPCPWAASKYSRSSCANSARSIKRLVRVRFDRRKSCARIARRGQFCLAAGARPVRITLVSSVESQDMAWA